MITKRIIPCLDVRDGRVVKGVNFEGLRDVSSPVALAEYYTENGADELDMVINIGLALEGNWHAVRDDIAAVVEAAQGKCVKVIVETCFLNKEQIAAACREAAQAGAQYVKTSTGMAEGGAKEEDVRLMHDTVLGRCRVKAAGGIRTLADCEKMIAAGAERIGTGNAASIAEEK